MSNGAERALNVDGKSRGGRMDCFQAAVLSSVEPFGPFLNCP
jgi:hypothetical protein